jgi:hypothetical protein
MFEVKKYANNNCNMRVQSYFEGITVCIPWPVKSTNSTAFFIVRLIGVYILPLIVLAFCYICSCVLLKRSLNRARRFRNVT